jgi:hypothetical protein
MPQVVLQPVHSLPSACVYGRCAVAFANWAVLVVVWLLGLLFLGFLTFVVSTHGCHHWLGSVRVDCFISLRAVVAGLVLHIAWVVLVC